MSKRRRPSGESKSKSSKGSKGSNDSQSNANNVNDNDKNGGIFDAITALESQDLSADTKQRRATERQVRQSMAASSQVKLYDHLMEVRILLQRIITTTTTMTMTTENDHDDHHHTEASKKESSLSSASIQKELMQTLLQHLMTARTTLTTGRRTPSDNNNNNIDEVEQQQQAYQLLKDEWKSVLNRRYKEVRLHSGLTAKAQFSLLDSDFWQQVDAVTQYELSSMSHSKNHVTTTDTATTMHFDDSKLYQHLLQDFLLGKSKTNHAFDDHDNNHNNNHNNNKKRRKLQQQKSSSTTTTDRKASKGRKVRYTVFPKLVNFTFPMQRPESILEEDEWFKSLFGGSNGGGGNTKHNTNHKGNNTHSIK